MLTAMANNVKTLIYAGKALPSRQKQARPVNAIAAGRVVFADWFRGQGLLIIVDHGKGYMSLYAHNESLLYKTGDWVEKNANIATVGRSGGCSNIRPVF